MEIRFKCPCGNILAAPAEAAGRKGRCPVCSRRLRVPGDEPESPDRPVQAEAEAQPEAQPEAAEAVVASAPEDESPEEAPASSEAEEEAPAVTEPPPAKAEAEAPPPPPEKPKPETGPSASLREALGLAQEGTTDEDENLRIVVADSIPGDLEKLRRALSDHGFDVRAAADGEEAIEAIREHKPHLAIVDLKTAKVGGFQVVRALTDQFNPLNADVWSTPFIMTCSKTTGRDKQYAVSIGVKHYIEKPVQITKLFDRIENILGRFPSGLTKK